MAEPDREAYEAAERLVREAQARAEEAARAADGRRPAQRLEQRRGAPPSDAVPGPGRAARGSSTGCAATLPPELARQLADALRELLIAIRAVLDYTIERLDSPPAREREVEDIPIR